MARLSPILVALLSLGFLTACAGTATAPEHQQPTGPAETLNVGIVVLDDQIVLNGRLYGDDHDTLVILTHMRPNDQTAWFPFAQALADYGYAALTFDFRGYGASDGDQDFAKLDEDLEAAINYMRARGRDKIFLVGASMGATTAIDVAAVEDVEGVVSISAPSEFEGHDAVAAIGNVSEPKLLIASEGDAAARVSLEELLAAAGQPVESQIYPGDAHGTDLFEGENAAAIRQLIFDFLDANS